MEESTSDKDSDVISEIKNMLRSAQNTNVVLASQLRYALPTVVEDDRRGSLHAVLQQVSQESFAKMSDDSSQRKKQVIFQLPRKSIHPTEVTYDEYIMPGRENDLMKDSFIRNLPVAIREKRHYRKSISLSMKTKPWSTKIHDFFARSSENFLSRLVIWNDTFKTIEGQHGAAIVAYFVFIRWLLYMNIIIFIINLCFLIIPHSVCSKVSRSSMVFVSEGVSYYSSESHVNVNDQRLMQENPFKKVEYEQIGLHSLHRVQDFAQGPGNFENASFNKIIRYCKVLYAEQIANNSDQGFIAFIQSMLQGTGPLEFTPLFLGFYSDSCQLYNVPFASVCVLLTTLIICLIMMITYSSVGVQEAFLARNKRSNYYSNEVFSAWDYGIDNSLSAAQEHNRFVLEMKSSLKEDHDRLLVSSRSTADWAKLYAARVAINLFVILWLYICFYLIFKVVVYQLEEQQELYLAEPGLKALFVQFLPSLTIVIFNSVSPTVFSVLVRFEKYSAYTETHISLFRNIFLSLSSFIVLLNTLYQQVTCKDKDICGAGIKSCKAPRCWETYVGQQLYKLCVIDLFVYIGVFIYDTIQNYVTRNFDNKFTRLWGCPVFSLPVETLSPIFSQTILWFGVFYSPLLPVVMIVKLIIIFYIKKRKLLVYCNPSEHSYRASRFNSVFILILLISFFIVLIVQSYAVDSIQPSRGCGPFKRFIDVIEAVPEYIRSWLSILTSYWTIAFTTFILCLLIHYYWRVTASQQELAKRLKDQLVLQSYDKQYLLKSLAELTGKKYGKLKQ